MTDPIADMLTRIRNSLLVKKQEVVIPFSKMKYEIAKILEKENYLEKVKKIENHFSEIKITLKYDNEGNSVIRNLKKISKPGQRIYSSYKDLPRVLGDKGIAIISTSRGIMTNKEARKRKLGGEVVVEIY